MKKSRIAAVTICLFALSLSRTATAQEGLPSIEEKTQGTLRMEGFFNFYWDDEEGKIWLEVADLGQEFLYINSLSSGLGSNPVGLDRGQLGRDRLVRFDRIGRKILLVEPNLRYRAVTDNPLERRAVEESFAQSILWGGPVVARSGDRLLVDFTPFVMRDAHNVTGTLSRMEQGKYRLDLNRSALYRPRTKNFPDNSEFEVILTFQTDGSPGRFVRETAPTPESVTLRQHHSFVRLPDDGYSPRRHDPRAATISMTFSDYASDLTEPLEKRYALRHRLQKKDPTVAISEAVEPIVYYVDSGAPQQIKEALVEGASWWNQAFEAAGFRNAFQVRILPEDADPMDVRYNVIQWVHRSTRGWSYGGSVSDPRTGEIIKGHVSLGSLRVRQDRLIFEAIQPHFDLASDQRRLPSQCLASASPSMEFLAELDPDARPVDVALARIRQLSAHEVGHTLGFAHNFAASTYAGRASVMDYPAPLVTIDAQGNLDMSDAYAVGIGEWDKIAVRYAYSQFPPGANEAQELEKIIQESIGKGYLFISDADARPPGAVHPLANLWDNGVEPVAGLRQLMQVRHLALQRFGQDNLAPGEPLALLQNTLVPLFLHHRYQVEAAVKVLGGANFTYARHGDGQKGVSWVPADQQRRALGAVLETLQASELSLPPQLLESIPPLPLGYFDERERFEGWSGPLFDPLGAARIAADVTLSGLLQHQRAHRLETLHALDAGNPDLAEVVDALFDATWRSSKASNDWEAAVGRTIRQAALDHLMRLAAHPSASPQVRAVASTKLRQWAQILENQATGSGGSADRAQRRLAVDEIRRFLERPAAASEEGRRLSNPPGSPIGATSGSH